MAQRPSRIGQQLGNYRLTTLLGEGGFAEVYLGEHIRLRTQAAIKVLHTHISPEEIEKFQKEAQTIANLVHPHIVRVFDFDVSGGFPFLVMEYCPDGTLRKCHPKGTVLALSTVVSYVKQLAEALQYAHDRKLIHRDIKPENMLIGQSNAILLSDFGIATNAHSTSSMSTQIPVGTIPYMAPEQIQAQARPASDQYALGIVVYEWLCGARPFEGSYTEIFAKHLMTPPPPLCQRVPNLPPDVEQVVMTALAKDPHQRFASVQAFATALEQASQPSQPAQSQLLAPTVIAPSSPLPPTVLATPPYPSVAQPTTVTPPNVPSILGQTSQSTQHQLSQSPPVTPLSNQPSLAGDLIMPSNPYPQRTTPVVATSTKAHVSLRIVITLTLLGVVLLSVIGGVGAYNIHSNQVDATATAIAINATAYATTTATAEANPYGGTLVLSDPLSDNSKGNQWDETSDNSGSSCAFIGGAYHVSETESGFVNDCGSEKLDFEDFAFQVKMKFVKGYGGGISFRMDSTKVKNYEFSISQNNIYIVKRYDDRTGYARALVGYASSIAINKGLGSTNTLAVVVKGSNMSFYVNNQLLANASDSTYSHGGIGFFANNAGTPTEVAFSNAKVWTL